VNHKANNKPEKMQVRLLESRALVMEAFRFYMIFF